MANSQQGTSQRSLAGDFWLSLDIAHNVVQEFIKANGREPSELENKIANSLLITYEVQGGKKAINTNAEGTINLGTSYKTALDSAALIVNKFQTLYNREPTEAEYRSACTLFIQFEKKDGREPIALGAIRMAQPTT